MHLAMGQLHGWPGRSKRRASVHQSQGGPSALLLAVRHPERVALLTWLSCGVASPRAGGRLR
jgi:enterochelin esterase-like enzyme